MNRIHNSRLFIVLIVFLSFCCHANRGNSQDTKFSVGYMVEQYDDVSAFDLIMNDFNAAHPEPSFVVDQSLSSPGISRGLSLGMKGNQKWVSGGLYMQFPRYMTKATGIDSAGEDYYKKIKISHFEFASVCDINLIHFKWFRAGPGFAFNLGQFTCKLRADDQAYTAYEKVADKFLLSATARFALSFGKSGGFNFDIVPYYTIPFWTVNLSNTYNELNNTITNVYTKEQLTFRPKYMGLAIFLSFKTNETDPDNDAFSW